MNKLCLRHWASPIFAPEASINNVYLGNGIHYVNDRHCRKVEVYNLNNTCKCDVKSKVEYIEYVTIVAIVVSTLDTLSMKRNCHFESYLRLKIPYGHCSLKNSYSYLFYIYDSTIQISFTIHKILELQFYLPYTRDLALKVISRKAENIFKKSRRKQLTKLSWTIFRNQISLALRTILESRSRSPYTRDPIPKTLTQKPKNILKRSRRELFAKLLKKFVKIKSFSENPNSRT